MKRQIVAFVLSEDGSGMKDLTAFVRDMDVEFHANDGNLDYPFDSAAVRFARIQ